MLDRIINRISMIRETWESMLAPMLTITATVTLEQFIRWWMYDSATTPDCQGNSLMVFIINNNFGESKVMVDNVELGGGVAV